MDSIIMSPNVPVRASTPDMQQHLEVMLGMLEPGHYLKMAAKIESAHHGRIRYIAVVGCQSRIGGEETCILGFDCLPNESPGPPNVTLGLVFCIYADTKIELDGDGGFSVTSGDGQHIFKPVSVHTLWSVLQCLHRASGRARNFNYFTGGTSHQWSSKYSERVNSDRSCLNEWNVMADIESKRPSSPDVLEKATDRNDMERLIKTRLRDLMMSVDLDEVTTKELRVRLETQLGTDLTSYKTFIDAEIITILGQMDGATKIFDDLFLGSEWNAANLDELKRNGVGHILNVTREIDNFFPGTFEYWNVRVYDEEATDLLKYWEETYTFIRKAKDNGSKVLVHCRMGVSRSASVVVAYAMKAYQWDLKNTLEYVKSKRACVRPNASFMHQLEVYEGILFASRQRHNLLFRSKSETNINRPSSRGIDRTDSVSTDDSGSRPPVPHETLRRHRGIFGAKAASHTGLSGILLEEIQNSTPNSRPHSWSPAEERKTPFFPGSPEKPVSSCVRLPGPNGEAYSVSQNQAVQLGFAEERPVKKQEIWRPRPLFSIGESPILRQRTVSKQRRLEQEYLERQNSIKLESGNEDRIPVVGQLDESNGELDDSLKAIEKTANFVNTVELPLRIESPPLVKQFDQWLFGNEDADQSDSLTRWEQDADVVECVNPVIVDQQVDQLLSIPEREVGGDHREVFVEGICTLRRTATIPPPVPKRNASLRLSTRIHRPRKNHCRSEASTPESTHPPSNFGSTPMLSSMDSGQGCPRSKSASDLSRTPPHPAIWVAGVKCVQIQLKKPLAASEAPILKEPLVDVTSQVKKIENLVQPHCDIKRGKSFKEPSHGPALLVAPSPRRSLSETGNIPVIALRETFKEADIGEPEYLPVTTSTDSFREIGLVSSGVVPPLALSDTDRLPKSDDVPSTAFSETKRLSEPIALRDALNETTTGLRLLAITSPRRSFSEAGSNPVIALRDSRSAESTPQLDRTAKPGVVQRIKKDFEAKTQQSKHPVRPTSLNLPQPVEKKPKRYSIWSFRKDDGRSRKRTVSLDSLCSEELTPRSERRVKDLVSRFETDPKSDRERSATIPVNEADFKAVRAPTFKLPPQGLSASSKKKKKQHGKTHPLDRLISWL